MSENVKPEDGQTVRDAGSAPRAARVRHTVEAASLLRAQALRGTAAAPRDRGVSADGASIAGGLLYTKALKGTLDAETAKVNALGARKRNCEAAVLTGHVAEADHVATFNVDAAFQGKTVRASRLDSNKHKSVDVAISDERTGRVLREVQVKVYRTAEKAADASRGYGDMDVVVPVEHVEPVKTYASRRAAKEAMKEGPNRAQVANEFETVAKQTTDRIRTEGTESRPRSRDQSREIAQRAKDGGVANSDVVGAIGRRTVQGAKLGARTGAITGGAIAGALHSVNAVASFAKGEKTAASAAADALRETAIDTVAAAAKGAASGAATAAARVVAENVASRLAKRALGGSAPAMVAVVAVDAALSAVSVAAGRKTWTEFGRDVASSAGTGVCGLVGAEIGFVLGGPIGAVIGGFCLPIAIEFAQDWLAQVRASGPVTDPTALARAVHDPAHIGAALRMMASARTGLERYRLSEMAALFEMLASSGAHVFPGRVVTGRNGYQTSAGIVVAHEGRAFAVDLRPWKGDLFPLGRRTVGPPRRLLQRRVRANGHVDSRELRNPLLGPFEFARAAKLALTEGNPRWSRTAIEPIVVFPTGELFLHGELVEDNRMLSREGLHARLGAGDGRATPSWMLDDLASLPVWDTIDAGDGLLQAAIESPGFSLELVDGSLEVPYSAVGRVEIDRTGTRDAGFAAATVFLRDATVLAGAVAEQPIAWNWKGRRGSRDLRTIDTICPGGFMPSDRYAEGQTVAVT